MAGGAMGGLREATLDGRTMPIRELAARGKVWTLNGLAESPREPLFTARRGETVLAYVYCRRRAVADAAEPRNPCVEERVQAR